VSALVLLRSGKSKRPRGLHPQSTSRVHGDGGGRCLVERVLVVVVVG
jgi:hypothetical protein